MAWYTTATPLTLTNPGAETGDTTGWTDVSGTLSVRTATPPPYAGGYYFRSGSSTTNEGYTTASIPAEFYTDVDAGIIFLELSWWQRHYDALYDPMAMGIAFYDSTPSLISRTDADETQVGWEAWVNRTLALAVPSTTRSIRIYYTATRTQGTTTDAYFDDVAVNLLEGVQFTGDIADDHAIGDALLLGFRSVIGTFETSPAIGDMDATGDVETTGLLQADALLGAGAIVAWNDFSGQLAGARINYVMDVSGGAADLRVPISSWQATLQTDRKCYLQCVIPAVEDYIAELTARYNAGGDFWVSRLATLDDDSTFEYVMARAPLSLIRYDRGSLRYSCTLSAYTDAITAVSNPTFYTRTLEGVRMTSYTQDVRVRCDIDWLLRPGHLATGGGFTFTVAYISYFVNAQDAYMDVGSRST